MTVFDPRDWGKVDYIVTQNVIRFVNQCSNTAKTLNLALPSNHLSPVRKEATLRHCSPLEAISQKLKTGLQNAVPFQNFFVPGPSSSVTLKSRHAAGSGSACRSAAFSQRSASQELFD